jgi:hypothetical protein
MTSNVLSISGGTVSCVGDDGGKRLSYPIVPRKIDFRGGRCVSSFNTVNPLVVPCKIVPGNHLEDCERL